MSALRNWRKRTCPRRRLREAEHGSFHAAIATDPCSREELFQALRNEMRGATLNPLSGERNAIDPSQDECGCFHDPAEEGND
jgi:hypothetical protein